ncbi:MAG TPA: hypothetical protein VFZ65_15950 [Planctomycetota bacterium]|nr:hypothetical protein [Planctomycetota bacterium]
MKTMHLARIQALAALIGAGPALAQQAFDQQVLDPACYVREWGVYGYDTRSREGPCVRVACGWNNTAHLRSDGQLFVQGQDGWGQTRVPSPGALRYVDMAVSSTGGMGILSDGTAVGWGLAWPTGFGLPPVAPQLPPGVRYLRVEMMAHLLLLRSDGVAVATGNNTYGEATVPALPSGVSVVDISASPVRSGLLLSDGSIRLFGRNDYGQNNIPTLPAGVTFTALMVQRDFTLALRSDGWIEAFGRNDVGQCNVPPLPAGQQYTLIAGGEAHGLACRSDNTLVTWGGTAWYGLANVPTIPAGLQCVQVDAGQVHSVARLSDGRVLSWGHNDFYEHDLPYRSDPGARPTLRYVDVSSGSTFSLLVTSDGLVTDFGGTNGLVTLPALPPGLRYVRTRAGSHHLLAMRSDGRVFAFGDNSVGQCNVPPLPAGSSYIDMAIGAGHSLLLRSDGVALAFGYNGWGECNIPALPAGMTYQRIAAYEGYSLLLRSDGTLHYVGYPAAGTQNVPQPPPGTSFVDIAGAKNFAVAICSDGTAIAWGSTGSSSWLGLPALPTGVAYVEGSGSYSDVALRRSDGQVVVVGTNSYDVANVPPLEPGTSYVQLSGYSLSIAGRVGPTSTYVGVAQGCSGSRPATRLIPRDTPRIGKPLPIRLLDLPADVAMLAMAFQELPLPIALAPFGMPGCQWRIPLDAVALVAGQNHEATFSLPIPDVPSLVGTRFYQQALVLDPLAGNTMGAVVSDTAQGVVGHW